MLSYERCWNSAPSLRFWKAAALSNHGRLRVSHRDGLWIYTQAAHYGTLAVPTVHNPSPCVSLCYGEYVHIMFDCELKQWKSLTENAQRFVLSDPSARATQVHTCAPISNGRFQLNSRFSIKKRPIAVKFAMGFWSNYRDHTGGCNMYMSCRIPVDVICTLCDYDRCWVCPSCSVLIPVKCAWDVRFQSLLYLSVPQDSSRCSQMCSRQGNKFQAEHISVHTIHPWNTHTHTHEWEFGKVLKEAGGEWKMSSFLQQVITLLIQCSDRFSYQSQSNSLTKTKIMPLKLI